LVVAYLAGSETYLVWTKCLGDLAATLGRDAVVLEVDLTVFAELIKRIVLYKLLNIAVDYFLETKSTLVGIHQVWLLADRLHVLS